jgi:hypothetical protein
MCTQAAQVGQLDSVGGWGAGDCASELQLVTMATHIHTPQ